jgi:hypothetical protein
MVRANIRISDAVTSHCLWAGRQEFRPEYRAPIQTEITRQICRVLHILLPREASRRAYVTSEVELGFNECLARGEAAPKGELCADLSAEAQKWFLAALARDPRNAEVLVGLALTCHLVSNPWSADPNAAAASDLGRETLTIALELEMFCSAWAHLEAVSAAHHSLRHSCRAPGDRRCGVFCD